MTAPRRVRKRCEKCGRVSMVKPRVRTCTAAESRMGGLFYCAGALVKAPVARTPKPAPSREALLLERRTKAGAALLEALTRIRRATTSAVTWRTKIGRIDRALEELRNPKPKPPRRPKTKPTRAYMDSED